MNLCAPEAHADLKLITNGKIVADREHSIHMALNQCDFFDGRVSNVSLLTSNDMLQQRTALRSAVLFSPLCTFETTLHAAWLNA